MRKGGLYLAIGDSTTWTQVTKGADLYSHRIWKAINTAYNPIRHINKGIGGQDSAEMVKNMRWNSTMSPDLVTIGVGMNDGVTGSGITTAQYKANLNTIIDTLKLRNSDVRIILCTPTRTNDPNRSGVNAYRIAMAEVVTERADSKVALCKFEDAWTDPQIVTYCIADGVHPNSAGHQKMFDVLWPVVQSVASDWLNSLR